MLIKTPNRKPGRKGTVATHPRRTEIELARAAGVSLERIAARFQVSRMAVLRHWQSLSDDYRAELATAVADIEGRRWQEVTAGLAAIARRHPEAEPDIAALAQHLRAMAPGVMIEGRGHAA